METKRIKCPVCGVVLDVRNSHGEDVKFITCPQCKSQLKVTFAEKRPSASDNGETQYVGGHSEEETVYLGNHDDNVLSAGCLECNGRYYELEFGENIVGRQASSSNANIQIAVADLYMSRQHICINDRQMSPTKVQAVLSNYHNKNSTIVDGQLVADGDQIVLSEGNKIKLGETMLTYHQKN